MANPGQGWNPLHGADQGPPPPGLGYRRHPQGQPGPAPQAAVYQPQFVYAQPASAPAPTPAHVPQVYWPLPPQQVYYQPYPAWPGALPPNPQPAAAPTNNSIPGVHLINSTGGVGLLPGYDLVHHAEHTKIHCIKSSTPPWQTAGTIHSWDPTKFHKLMVPSNMTVTELLTALGCDNKDASKNVVHEIMEKGNGTWSKGLTIRGDQKDRVKKTIKAWGWDSTRTGEPGEHPLVWLYLTKD